MSNSWITNLSQVFDAGEMFGIMQVEEEEEDEESERRPNPGDEMHYKVIVTRESGLQAADPTRWGQQWVWW